jgi:predicted TIM-barrel fold metal-dependent hydrolase
MDGKIREADVRALLELAAYANVYVKVSAFYALGRKQTPHEDLPPLARRV